MAKNSISFSYERYPKTDPKSGKIIGEKFYPIVVIKLEYGHQITRPFRALVDSGSDRNLFPAHIGESIGMSFRKIKPVTIKGIGKGETQAYTKKVKLIIDTNEYDTEVDFSYDQQMPLLGREGFFDLFERISFNHKSKFFEIKI